MSKKTAKNHRRSHVSRCFGLNLGFRVSDAHTLKLSQGCGHISALL